jgi:prevent-host-death family protein
MFDRPRMPSGVVLVALRHPSPPFPAAPLRKHPTDYYNDHVTITLTATEAKATILSLLDDVAAGAEVQITKHGRVVARLVPARGAPSLKGLLTGVAMSTAEDNDLFSTGLTWNLA